MLNVKKQKPDALILTHMVEGAAYHRAVGIVGRLSFPIVYHKSGLVAVEGASHKDIIAAVVDASVEIFVADNV